MRRTPLLLILLGSLLVPPQAPAQEVGLAEALRLAVERRPQAVAARAQAHAARASAEAAGARLLPRIGLRENFMITDEPASSLFISLNQEDLRLHTTADPYNDPPTRHDFETSLVLEQPLFDLGLWHGRRAARQGARAAEASARWTAERSAFAAFRAYLQLQQAVAAVEWAESALRESEEIERLAREHYEAGTGLKADHLRARVALSEAQRRLLAVRNDLLLARRALALAMGLPDSEPTLAAPVRVGDFPAALERSIGDRSDLEALRYTVARSEAAVDESEAAWWPRLDLKGSYSLHDEAPFGAEAQSWQIWSGLSWDLWNGGQRPHRIAAARACKRTAEARLQEATNEAAYRLEEARLQMAEARLRMETTHLAVAEAEESLSLLQQRYEAGLSPLSDLLGVRSALDRARFDRLQAETALLTALGRSLLEQGRFLQILLPERDLP